VIGLLCFALAVLASPFKSNLRLEAENAVLRPPRIPASADGAMLKRKPLLAAKINDGALFRRFGTPYRSVVPTEPEFRKSGNEDKARSSVTAISPPSTKGKIGGKKSYRAVSSASDFRNDGWAQTVKNLSAISGYFAGNPVIEERHVIDGRPRNFTKNARSIYGGPNA